LQIKTKKNAIIMSNLIILVTEEMAEIVIEIEIVEMTEVTDQTETILDEILGILILNINL
jgi:phosphatidylglycerophosphatase A